MARRLRRLKSEFYAFAVHLTPLMTRRLLYLNGIAILSVLLFHGAGWGLTALFTWAHRYLPVVSPDFSQAGSVDYYILRLVEQLVVFCIPAFLFVSGYFVAFTAGRREMREYLKPILARLKFLIIPYILWSLIFVALRTIEGQSFSIIKMVTSLLTGATTPAYYFVPLLIQYYLLAILLIPLAKNHWKALLLITGIFQLFAQSAQYIIVLGLNPEFSNFFSTWFPKWFFPVRLFYFVAGMVFGLHLSTFKGWIFQYRRVWLAAAGLLFVIGVIEWEWLIRRSGNYAGDMQQTLVDGLYSLAVIFTVLGFTNKTLPLSKKLSDIGVKSFAIYLIHIPVMEYFSRGIYHLAPGFLQYQAIFMVTVALTGLLVPLLILAIFKRLPIKRLYSYVFG